MTPNALALTGPPPPMLHRERSRFPAGPVERRVRPRHSAQRRQSAADRSQMLPHSADAALRSISQAFQRSRPPRDLRAARSVDASRLCCPIAPRAPPCTEGNAFASFNSFLAPQPLLARARRGAVIVSRQSRRRGRFRPKATSFHNLLSRPRPNACVNRPAATAAPPGKKPLSGGSG